MDRRRLVIAISVTSVLLLIGVGLAATRFPSLQGRAVDRTSVYAGEPAPDFVGVERWLNTDQPQTIEGLRGSVVLVDFWTYTCINCVRTFPHLRALYGRYAPFGLEIVGVHSPEFDFERDPANVAAAVERYQLPYPVAMDNDMETWRAYRNNWWPHVYLVDATGTIRYDHIGEGGEEEIQEQIRALLTESGAHLPDALDFDRTSVSAHVTPEVYAGFERGATGGHLGNPGGYTRGAVTEYGPITESQIETAGTRGLFFLEGPWEAQDEYVRAAGEGARVVLPFFARDVFFVGGGEGRVRVRLDGAPIRDADAGEDVVDSIIEVDRADLFTAVRLDQPARGVLTLEAAPGFELFTFTFG